MEVANVSQERFWVWCGTWCKLFASCAVPQSLFVVGSIEIIGANPSVCNSCSYQFPISKVCVQKDVVRMEKVGGGNCMI
jgi:hypothetical protein